MHNEHLLERKKKDIERERSSLNLFSGRRLKRERTKEATECVSIIDKSKYLILIIQHFFSSECVSHKISFEQETIANAQYNTIKPIMIPLLLLCFPLQAMALEPKLLIVQLQHYYYSPKSLLFVPKVHCHRFTCCRPFQILDR
jgi:hypothetical protein